MKNKIMLTRAAKAVMLGGPNRRMRPYQYLALPHLRRRGRLSTVH
jgi:hypothetical protein